MANNLFQIPTNVVDAYMVLMAKYQQPHMATEKRGIHTQTLKGQVHALQNRDTYQWKILFSSHLLNTTPIH